MKSPAAAKQLGVEDVHETADPRAEIPPDAVEDLDRARLALVREPHEPVGVDRRAEHLLRELRRREPRHIRLEMPAARAGALTRNAVVLDHDVAELGPAAIEPAVDDGSPATAGAEREHHHRPRFARCAEVELRIRSRVRVVLDSHRQAEPLGHARAEVDALVERDVDGLLCAPRALVDRRRDAEAERGDIVGQQLLDRGVQARQ
jgi:hypothetical protein